MMRKCSLLNISDSTNTVTNLHSFTGLMIQKQQNNNMFTVNEPNCAMGKVSCKTQILEVMLFRS